MIMATNSNSSFVWDQRFKEIGHTGYFERMMYEYDQSLRLRIIKKLTQKLVADIKNKRVLDVGCGVGDFSFMFANMGADVTGIDITKPAIEKAKENVKGFSCKFLVTSIKEMDFTPKSFDIILSITVLQHISNKDLHLSIAKMVESLNSDGYIFILETAPDTLKNTMIDSENQSFRSRNEWIEFFENADIKLNFEMIYPSFGLSLIKLCNDIASTIYHTLEKKSTPKKHYKVKNQMVVRENGFLFKIQRLVERIILFFSKPIDYYVPVLAFGTTRIMVFKKESTADD